MIINKYSNQYFGNFKQTLSFNGAGTVKITGVESDLLEKLNDEIDETIDGGPIVSQTIVSKDLNDSKELFKAIF